MEAKLRRSHVDDLGEIHLLRYHLRRCHLRRCPGTLAQLHGHALDLVGDAHIAPEEGDVNNAEPAEIGIPQLTRVVAEGRAKLAVAYDRMRALRRHLAARPKRTLGGALPTVVSGDGARTA